MFKRERAKFIALLILRCLGSFFDLAGVLAVGFLGTSIALFVAKGSDQQRTFNLLGYSVEAANIKTLPLVVCAILVLFILKAASAILLTQQLASLVARIEARAARTVAESILGGQLKEARAFSKEEILFATTIGCSSAFTGLLNNLSTLLAEGFMFVALVATFIIVDPFATLAVLFYFLAIGWLIHLFVGRRMSASSDEIMRNSILSNMALNDLSQAFRELTVLGRKNLFFEKIEAARLSSASNIGRQVYLASMPRYIVETAVLVGVMVFGGFQILQNDLTHSITTVGVFFTGSLRIMAAMLPWQGALISIKQNIPQAQTAQIHFGRPKLPLVSTHQISIDESYESPPEIVVRNLTYHHPGSSSPSIQDVSLTIPSGSHVAVVGPSGAGKSTLADALMGLIEPTSGSVEINGMAPKQVISLRPGSLSYVPQHPGAVSGTIKANIAIGVPESEIQSDSVSKSLQAAHLDKLITELPLGAETDLGKHNDSLSGGQLQRVGLARALYTNPTFMIMDEATSALDAESEYEITKSLEGLRGKVTVMIVAHRLNTIKNSDLVFLMESGCLVDQGTFNDLVIRNPSLARAVELMDLT